ncbi:hypothetical protein ACKGF9_001730 [Providencia rettgeri]
MAKKEELKTLVSDRDSYHVSHNASKLFLVASIIGTIMGLIFHHDETVLFVFVVIGFIFYFFHTREKLKKSERDLDYSCLVLFGKKYKESSAELFNYLYK